MKSVWLLAACLCMLPWAGCRKDDPPPRATPRAGGCEPYRVMSSVTLLLQDLNAFVMHCDKPDCKGPKSNTKVKENPALLSPAGVPYAFDGTQLVGIGTQNEMIDQAWAWANANKPMGYFVQDIKFILQSTPISDWSWSVRVTYKRCYNMCEPFDDVEAMQPLLDALKYFANCQGQECSGASVTVVDYVYFTTPGGGDYSFVPGETVNFAQQMQILEQAKAAALAAKPGYFISYMEFFFSTGNPATLYARVKYKKCIPGEGGGGGNN